MRYMLQRYYPHCGALAAGIDAGEWECASFEGDGTSPVLYENPEEAHDDGRELIREGIDEPGTLRVVDLQNLRAETVRLENPTA